MWSPSNLLRLGHAHACRDLSDLARSFAVPYERESGAELVDSALRLVSQADMVLELAVAVAREQGTSWEEIGEQLPGPDGETGVSRQAASKRFGERVEALSLDALLPRREPRFPGALGWWAGPDGLDDPDRTAADLDAWVVRHRERTDPDRGAEPVSGPLRARHRPATDSIGATTRLASLLLDATGPFATRDLPAGVSERYVRQRLLEFKVETFGAILENARRAGRAGRDVAESLTFWEQSRAELGGLYAEDCREALSFEWDDEQSARVQLRGRPLVTLARTVDARARDVTGWWLWSTDVEDPSAGGAWPQLVDVGLGAEHEHVEHAAAVAIAEHVASDRVKGVGPFDAAGLAGGTEPSA